MPEGQEVPREHHLALPGAADNGVEDRVGHALGQGHDLGLREGGLLALDAATREVPVVLGSVGDV